MDSSEGWQHYCEKIENALENADIEFDDVEVIEDRFTTYLKIEGVEGPDDSNSKDDTTIYGLPDDPDEAADNVVQQITGKQVNE